VAYELVGNMDKACVTNVEFDEMTDEFEEEIGGSTAANNYCLQGSQCTFFLKPQKRYGLYQIE
jgi:hypothetical protein